MGATDPVVPLPPAPDTLEQSGLNIDLVIQLVLKTLHLSGTMTGLDLAGRLGVRFAVLEPALDQIKWQHHIEIVGGSMLGAAAYKYRITDAGRERAVLFLEANHYVGAAPVPLAQYQAYMREFQRRAVSHVTPRRVREAFAHLVLSDRVLDALGPAIRAGRSMFVYGPPGNGKTVISQAIGGLLDGSIAIPQAVEIEGAIVRVFDPVNHAALARPEPEGDTGLTERQGFDRRWVPCSRPCVMAGGELTLDLLELSYNPTTGFYRAPVQALANGGVLVIDDFGRQRCAPRDLLNRWIVPLESGVDFLTLQTGLKFEIPFATLVVFATNIKPAELVDEAFLRRIQYKIFAESPTEREFLAIFENYCRAAGISCDPAVVGSMLAGYFKPRRIALRGCQPRDLVNQALAMADYMERPRQLTVELLAAACETYFVDDREVPATFA